MSAEEEQPYIPTLRERMAALQLDQANIGRASIPIGSPSLDQVAVKKAKPPPPPLPAKRSASTNIPTSNTNGGFGQPVGNKPDAPQKELLPAPVMKKWEGRDEDPRPALPSRRPSDKSAPSLPPRRPSEQLSLNRQDSRESLASIKSALSSTSAASTPRTSISTASTNGQATGKFRIRAPEYDPATLPPLPEKKKTNDVKEEKPRLPLRPTVSSPNVNSQPSVENRPELPARPTLPPRPGASTKDAKQEEETPPPMPPRRSALDFALNKSTETPPPLPLASRPNLAELNKSKPKLNGHSATNGTANGSSSEGECLLCRDFSGPDNHAARFPRESIPTTDIKWIGKQLTSPFSSETDKARAIFTWLHHNIAYDVKAFFGKCVRGKTPAQTVETGLAVCEGYAGLFAALATASGLEAIVVGGHGKGVGYNITSADAPLPPPDITGHAWSAVRLETGWKLLDACWGAGHVRTEDESYHKAFNPAMFTQSNEEFGERHFPADGRHWFARPRTWEEYLRADLPQPRVTVYTGAETNHGLSEKSFEPRAKNIAVAPNAGPARIRFQFKKVCPHWDLAAKLPGNGKPYLFVLKIYGRGGGDEEHIPFETDVHRGGDSWWCDVERAKLGRPGQDILLYVQDKYLDGRDGRGLTKEEYYRTRPNWRMWSFQGVAQWTLV